MRTRTAKILKGVAITLLVLGVLYAIGVVVSSAKLRRAYAALEKGGRPMKPAEIIPPDVPGTENAALLYKSAILLLEAQPVPSAQAQDENLLGRLEELSRLFLTESLDAEQRAELEQLLAQNVVLQALSVVEQGTHRRQCRFDYDYEAGFNMIMPHLSGLRNLIRILGAKASLEAQAGRSKAAWDLAMSQLRFADAMRKDPVLISQLIRFSSIRVSCETIQKLCESDPPDDEHYRNLESLLLDYQDNTPLVLAFDGERLLGGEWVFNLLKTESGKVLGVGSGNDDESGLERLLMSLYAAFKPLSLADQAAYMRILGDHTRFAQQPYRLSEQNALDAPISRLHLVTSITVPALGRVYEVFWETVAQMRITRAGLAILQEKKAGNSFPDALEPFASKQAGDPFSDGPLRYRSADGGFVLYSVGPDQTDDGGRPRQKRQETGWDIVWQFPAGEQAEAQ
ncbi:MAG: hypothetical protein JSW66_04355 [Phycisphaerales bacterium]|nr:MAG: hypothetical protein JSW66_04355 [Phycisphaerales bacterium]